MTLLQRLFSILTLLLLAACGGGENAGTPPFGGGGGGGTGSSAVTDLVVTLSAPTIVNSGSASVTATVMALDSNRNAVPNSAVTVSADNGGVLTILGTAGSVTDATGKLQAAVTIGANLTPRTIKVSATAAGVTRSADLQVVASPTTATPATIELIASATTVGTGGDTVTITAFVKDLNNNTLPSVAVAFTTDTGTLSGVGATTNAQGFAVATFSSGGDRSNRDATIRVAAGTISQTLKLPITGTKLSLSGPTSLILGTTAAFDVVVTDSKTNVVPGVTVTATSSLGNTLAAVGGSSTSSTGQVRFNYTANSAGTDNLVFRGAGATISPNPPLVVSGQDFAFVSPAASTTVPVNTPQVVQVRLRVGGVGKDGQVINFAATGGTLSSTTATTAGGGFASVTLTSASAGPVTVQASVGGTDTSTTLPLMVVATVPSKLVLQVSPTAIAPNLGGSTTNQAQVLAKVTDAAGNPVQGATVNFTRVTDPSGGNLLQPSSTTDANGQATAIYQAGSQSTANNGVVLKATVASAPAVSGQANLTVNQSALFIALGTGNVISNVDPQTYKKDWVAYVTDSNGIAVNGATLTIKAIPTYYLTGVLVWDAIATSYVYAGPIYRCRNEDLNANGILDGGEDDNGDGVLWPGNVIAVSPSNVQTVNGRATISLLYAESYAPWVQLRLTASATVSGTESRTDAEFIVGGDALDFTVKANPPAGVVSPFGTAPKAGAVCTLLIP